MDRRPSLVDKPRKSLLSLAASAVVSVALSSPADLAAVECVDYTGPYLRALTKIEAPPGVLPWAPSWAPPAVAPPSADPVDGALALQATDVRPATSTRA